MPRFELHSLHGSTGPISTAQDSSATGSTGGLTARSERQMTFSKQSEEEEALGRQGSKDSNFSSYTLSSIGEDEEALGRQGSKDSNYSSYTLSSIGEDEAYGRQTSKDSNLSAKLFI